MLLAFFILWSTLASAQVSPCRTSQLLATKDLNDADGIEGGLGHHAMMIAIQNRSSSSCVLRGIPAMELSYTATHRPFAIHICANCNNQMFHPQPVTDVPLEPKHSAWVVLGYDINDGNGRCTEPDPKYGPTVQYSDMTLSLYLPGQHQQPLKVSLDQWRSCGEINVSPFLKQPPRDGSLP